jgi:hypothetical protein
MGSGEDAYFELVAAYEEGASAAFREELERMGDDVGMQALRFAIRREDELGTW